MNKKRNAVNKKYLIMFALIQFPLRFEHYVYLTYIFIYLLPLLYLIYHIQWSVDFIRRIANDYAVLSIILFVGLFLESFLWPFIMGTFEFSFVTEYWRRFFLLLIKNVFLLSFYELNIKKQQRNMDDYIKYYLYAVVIYIAFTVLTILSKNLREILMNCLYLTEKNRVDLQYASYFTRFGWSGWSGFDETMHCTIGVSLSCILILKNKNRTNEQMRYLFLVGIMLLGNMFYGRTGLTISLLCLMLTSVIAFFRGQLKFVCLLFLLLLFVLGILLFLKEYISAISNWYDWAFSAFINLIEFGRFRDNTGSLGYLFDKMYWVPQADTFFLGDGYYTYAGKYYMETDSGIMRLMLYFGIPNYLLGVVGYVFVLWAFVKKNCESRICKEKFWIFMMLVMMTVLFEIKGETFYKMACIFLPMAFIKQDKLIKQERCN